MAKTTKKRRKPDGTTELVGDCPVCGSRNNYEVNLTTRKQHCWSCGYGGVYNGPLLLPLFDGPAKSTSETRAPGFITNEIPERAHGAISKRGFDAEYVIARYDVQWDGVRLCWPTGSGFARRAIYPWEEPKVLSAGQKGLIGYHLLRTDQDVVLVEGDYKAASIPHPWIGLGLQGTEITDFQAMLLATHSPRSITVMLDHGYDTEATTICARLLVKIQNVKIHRAIVPPPGPGPDDVPRAALIRNLLFPTQEYRT